MSEEISRREFVKQTVVGTAILAGPSTGALPLLSAGTSELNKEVVAALGSAFIPSTSGDPGYKELEAHGITGYVMEKLPGGAFELFNNAAKQLFNDKTFLELEEKQREQYLEDIIDGSKIADA